eukprot:jgi/Chlat1/1735/Chrsp13S02165
MAGVEADGRGGAAAAVMAPASSSTSSLQDINATQFSSAQYGFFTSGGELDGELEPGLEAPPEEEGLPLEALGGDDDDDDGVVDNLPVDESWLEHEDEDAASTSMSSLTSALEKVNLDKATSEQLPERLQTRPPDPRLVPLPSIWLPSNKSGVDPGGQRPSSSISSSSSLAQSPWSVSEPAQSSGQHGTAPSASALQSSNAFQTDFRQAQPRQTSLAASGKPPPGFHMPSSMPSMHPQSVRAAYPPDSAAAPSHRPPPELPYPPAHGRQDQDLLSPPFGGPHTHAAQAYINGQQQHQAAPQHQQQQYSQPPPHRPHHANIAPPPPPASHLNWQQQLESNYHYDQQFAPEEPRLQGGKFMSAEEIQGIVRAQMAATQFVNPYADDYYYLACLEKQDAKNPGLVPNRTPFAPPALREVRPQSGKAQEHAYLHVEGLGRVNYSNIRTPKPLLELALRSESPASSDSLNGLRQRPLEEEPLLAARLAIEDGMSVMLDVDDIERVVKLGLPPAAVQNLQRRRYALLEDFASSLRLGEPFAGQHVSDASHDQVLLRLLSLHKGRRLLSRYLRAVPLGSPLMVRVVLPLMRHINELFGQHVVSDLAADSMPLASAVAEAAGTMDIIAIVACVSAVASAGELPLQPSPQRSDPRPAGTVMVLQAMLDRAATLLNTRAGGSATPPAVFAAWRSVFGALFRLVLASVVQRMTAPVTSIGETDVAVLRALVPHCDAAQEEQLRWCWSTVTRNFNPAS